MRDSIDFAAIRSASSLRQVVVADLGEPLRGGRWACPLHGGDGPNFAILADELHFRCWTCGAAGDVLDYLRAREGLTLIEAARRIDPAAFAGKDGDDKKQGMTTRPKPTPKPKPPAPPEPWEDPHWQKTVASLIDEAVERLWSAEGRPALDWLRGRGLEDRTIRFFKLGFNPTTFTTEPHEVLGRDHRGRRKGIHCPRGVLLPWVAPGSCHADEPFWLGCTVRLLMPNVNDPLPLDQDKCRSLTGSRKGRLYPFPTIDPSQGNGPILIVEGELDALTAHQEAGALVIAGTVGGAAQTPHASALEVLANCSPWLIATDHDEAGVEAAWRWRERNPEIARRVFLPHSKDLNEYHTKGGDVAAWVRSLLAEHAALIPPEVSDWREIVAAWPHASWVRWRRRSAELQAAFPGTLAATDVRLADRLAYDELAPILGGAA